MSTDEQTNKTANYIVIGFMLIIGLATITNLIIDSLNIGKPELDIIAAAQEANTEKKSGEKGWQLSGKVLYKGSGMESTVWAIARDSSGNRFATKSQATDKSGNYTLEVIPQNIGGAKDKLVSDVTIFATSSISQDNADDKEVLEGKEVLGLSEGGVKRSNVLSPFVLITIAVIFCLSLFVGLLRFSENSSWLVVQYYFSAVLAIVFTVIMIFSISAGLYMVNASQTPGDSLSIGFATIYHGTFVTNTEADWLFSLSAAANTEGKVAKGLGAPLWVLFLSVLGSAVYTVALIVKHINKELGLKDPSKVREHIQQIVNHQFYILFSPLAAVIVYQLLVISGAASQAVTVGMVAIAAGVKMNQILDKSAEKMVSMLDKHK